MKKLDEMTEPDFLSTAFAVVDLSDGSSRKVVLADFYKYTDRIRISETAPEHVRSYMEAIKTLFVYGWRVAQTCRTVACLRSCYQGYLRCACECGA